MAVAVAVLLWLSLWPPLLRGAAVLHSTSLGVRAAATVSGYHGTVPQMSLLLPPLWPPLRQCRCFTANAHPAAVALEDWSCHCSPSTANENTCCTTHLQVAAGLRHSCGYCHCCHCRCAAAVLQNCISYSCQHLSCYVCRCGPHCCCCYRCKHCWCSLLLPLLLCCCCPAPVLLCLSL